MLGRKVGRHQALELNLLLLFLLLPLLLSLHLLLRLLLLSLLLLLFLLLLLLALNFASRNTQLKVISTERTGMTRADGLGLKSLDILVNQAEYLLALVFEDNSFGLGFIFLDGLEVVLEGKQLADYLFDSGQLENADLLLVELGEAEQLVL